MENEQLSGSNPASALTLNSSAKKYLKQAAKWIKFLSIVGIIFSIHTIAELIFPDFLMLATPGHFATAMILLSTISVMGGIFYALLIVFFMYAFILLFQFSKRTKLAIETDDETALEIATQRLRSAIRIFGILTIIMLVYYGLALLLFLVAGDNIFKSALGSLV